MLQKEAWNGILKLSQNNGEESIYQAGAQPINNSEKYYIGSTSDVLNGKTTPFFDGHIATVLIYNKILSLAEKIILENHLSAKYSLPLLHNDLYTFDENQMGNYDHELIGIGKASDGSQQLSAKGDGILEINNQNGFEKGDFMFIAHNGKALDSTLKDCPNGLQYRFDRKWKYSKVGNETNIEILVDPKEFPNIVSNKLFMLIDSNNDGNFEDETTSTGVFPITEITNNGKYVFRINKLQNGNTFTFAKQKETPVCLNDCDDIFSPNGDGNADVILIKPTGKSTIVDKSGKMIKSIQTPAYWDGTNVNGELVSPGIYFVLLNEDVYTTITLIR